MKILYLKLKNYASIYTAMGLKEIEIDFTKSKNSVVLFVGDNGSGKTSLLSTLHPFPYYGSMDPRNNTSIIREDKDGFKEIHIQYDNDVYKIQHHYKNTKRGIVLKSFIQKNDEELNPNGNVTSFNEVIKNELSLELDFLRLLRLGSNVTNLIDMKSSERKSFTSYLLTDINMYNELFKKVSEDNRILKNMIKTVSDKLYKLNVFDKTLLRSEIDNIEKWLKESNEYKDNLQHQLGIVEGKISTLVPEGIDSIILETKQLRNDILTEENIIRVSKNGINKLCVVLVYSIDKELEIISNKIHEKENEQEVNLNVILFYREQLNGLYNKKSELENVLRVSVSDENLKQMTELYANMLSKSKIYDKKYKDYTPVYSKDNLLSLLEILKQIDAIANETYGFDKRAIIKTVELLKRSENVSNYIAEKHKEIDKEVMKITVDLKSAVNPKNPVILFRPQNCPEDKCPYLFLYDMLFSNDSSSNTKSLATLENEKELLESMSLVNTNIDYIFMILNTNKNLISKGDIPYFNISNILESLLNGRSVFNEDYMTDLISEVEEYEDYLDMKIKLKELKTELNLIQSNTSITESTKKELASIDINIADILAKIFELESKNSALTDDITNMTYHKNSLIKYSDFLNSIDTASNNIVEYKQRLNDKETVLRNVSGLDAESKELKRKIELVIWEIDKYSTDAFNLKVKLREFNALTEEHNLLNEKFDDINIIRESLSSTKGIPLLYMQLYLKNIKIFVNELLKIVYADNFEIDDFEITESEFNIPYIKNNIRISDVMFASQGEKSFLSLAISFALINQSIKDYNILLLDEIDSTLDTRNRGMFLNILEKQMESINSEQIFLITHNNMFENYPVDIILTSKNKTTNFNNANIIFSV